MARFRSQATAHSPQPMQRSWRCRQVFSFASTASAAIGHAAAQRPQWTHLAGSSRGRKCGGAIIPGTLNSLMARIAWQQHPQQEHEHCPLVAATFMIQLTMPWASASRLMSSISCLLDLAERRPS